MATTKKVITLTLAISLFSGITASALAASPSPSNPYGGIAVDPLGPNETILVISKGKLIKRLTFNSLMKLNPKEISIYEPFVKVRQKFTVVKLSTLFAQVGITANDKVSTIALNDYVYENLAKNFTSADGYLAIKRNGKLIPYDQGGPIRIIYPTDSRWAKFLDPWNWSLTRISVK